MSNPDLSTTETPFNSTMADQLTQSFAAEIDAALDDSQEVVEIDMDLDEDDGSHLATVFDPEADSEPSEAKPETPKKKRKSKKKANEQKAEQKDPLPKLGLTDEIIITIAVSYCPKVAALVARVAKLLQREERGMSHEDRRKAGPLYARLAKRLADVADASTATQVYNLLAAENSKIPGKLKALLEVGTLLGEPAVRIVRSHDGNGHRTERFDKAANRLMMHAWNDDSNVENQVRMQVMNLLMGAGLIRR